MSGPPRTLCLHDKSQIEAFLHRDIFLHLYALGDLDDRFWPFTTWYAAAEDGRIRAVAMVYSGLSVPTLLALGGEEMPQLRSLLRALTGLLPRRFFAHFSPGLAEVLQPAYSVTRLGPHYKMALADRSRLEEIDVSGVVPLAETDADVLGPFLAEHSPRSWFHPYMLATRQYFGLRNSEGLLSVAGVHVYSEPYRAAALANVATHAAHRGKGHATTVVAALCKNLLKTVDHIGLNVAAENAAALRCYQRLGFEVVAEYEECEAAAAGFGGQNRPAKHEPRRDRN